MSAKNRFDLVGPGTTGGCEMKAKLLAFPGLQPTLHFGALVSRIVVHDEMNLLIGGKMLLQVIQETHEFPAAWALETPIICPLLPLQRVPS